VSEIFVPGRLCLLGEHSDWAGRYRVSHPQLHPGCCLVVGTQQGLRARAEHLDGEFELSSRLADGAEVGPTCIPARLDSLESAAIENDFFGYAAGVAAEMVERYGVGGLRLTIEADLPVRKGLSSSAAVCVLVARAFSRVYGLGLQVADEMEIAFCGERRTGSECGRMDQVCAYGRRATFLRFDGESLEVEVLEPRGVFHLLVVDLRRDKDTRRILTDLNACFPDAPGTRAAAVREALGAENAALLVRARAALAEGNAAALGAVMEEAQALFDAKVAPACPELVAPRLHQVLAHPAVLELGFGGKGVGSQGDGCAQVVARGASERGLLAEILEREFEVHCLPLTLSRGAKSAGGSF
jgi:galactokinase